MITPPSEARPFIRVFVPYEEIDGGRESPGFDNTDARADVALWMESFGCEWEWVEISASTLAAEIARTRDQLARQPLVVLNHCDGDDVNGFPGVSVVKALEAAHLPFTGADSRFYELSTSKCAMKRRFVERGIRTTQWVEIREVVADIERAGATLGWPLFIKPDISAASCGITPSNNANNVQEAIGAAEATLAGMHGFDFRHGGVFAEPFLAGREFTVLVVSDGSVPGGVRAFIPAERAFNTALPVGQRFVTCHRATGDGEEEDAALLSADSYAYNYARAPDELHAELMELARRAFAAVDGTGYARVDIRYDSATSLPHVLEVNANCGIATSIESATGSILQFSEVSIGSFIESIVRDALLRHRRGSASVSQEPIT